MSSEIQDGTAVAGGLHGQLRYGPAHEGGRDFVPMAGYAGQDHRGHLGAGLQEPEYDSYAPGQVIASDQGRMQGHEDAQGLGPHETLLSQYKKCSRINNQQLRNARNLEQLVGIKVHAIDGRLGTSGQGAGGRYPDGTRDDSGGQPHYDFKFDPLHFRQKVPCMADRSFLINQAILSSSTQRPRVGFGGSNAVGRLGTASTGTSFGPGHALASKGSPPFSGASTTTNKQHRRGVMDPRRGHHAALSHNRPPGSLGAGEQLFSGGFDAVSHGGAGTAGSVFEAQELLSRNPRTLHSLPAGPGTTGKASDGQQTGPGHGPEGRDDHEGERTSDPAAVGSYKQADSRDGSTQEGQDSPTDPINALKSIFKPKERAKRAPLDLNPVMKKYRQRHHTTSQRIRSMRPGVPGGSRNGSKYGNPLHQLGAGKVFKEDFPMESSGGKAEFPASQADQFRDYLAPGAAPQPDMMAQPGGNLDHRAQLQDRPHEELMDGELERLQAGQQPQVPAFRYGDVGSSHQTGQSRNSQFATTRELDVKEKLESLRKLFAEEDINETVKGIQHDWELEDQKISDQKQGLFKSKFNATQSHPRPAEPALLGQGEDGTNNDLRGYLTRKIWQIQDRSDPQSLHEEQLRDQRRDTAQDGEQARGQYKFKASTLTHIAELRGVGQEKIENQFIERLFREQTDYHFEKYAHGKQKEYTKQAAALKHRQMYQTAGLVSEAGASRGSYGEGDAQESAGKARLRGKKPKNIVQEQLMKIERINRESEKHNKELRQEVRHPEIYDIINETQEEVNRMEQGRELEGALMSDLAELAARSRQEVDGEHHAVSAALQPGERPAPDARFGGKIHDHLRDEGPLGGERLIAIQKSNDQQPEEQLEQAQAIDHEAEQVVDASKVGGAQAPDAPRQPNELISADGVMLEQPGAAAKSGDRAQHAGGAPQSKARKQASPQSTPNKTITSKVGIHSVMNVDMKDVQPERPHFRVSQLVQDYNERHRGVDSPPAEPAYLSDTELFMSSTRNYLRGRLSPESRGGGFRDRRQRQGAAGQQQAATTGQFNDRSTEAGQKLMGTSQPGVPRRPLGQIDEEPLDITHGNSFSYFCPKRFNRYPRFTIFFKRDRAGMSNQYILENTVSLSPQFLSYLMDKNNGNARNSIASQEEKPPHTSVENRNQQVSQPRTGASLVAGEGGLPRGSIAENADAHNNLQKLQAHSALGRRTSASPTEEAVTGWNAKNEMVQNYDPFEKVVLVKGIDNSILTSFRTLKRENNTVSDTFKIVHQKFLPSKLQGLYFKSLQKNQADKLTLYPHSDNEDALEVAHAELLAESLLHQADETHLMNEDQQRQLEIAQLSAQHQQRQPDDAPGRHLQAPAAPSDHKNMKASVQGATTVFGQGGKADQRGEALMMPSAARPQALLLNNKHRIGEDPNDKVEIAEDGAAKGNQKHIGDAKHPMTLIRANIVNQRAHGQAAVDDPSKLMEGNAQNLDGQPGNLGQKGQLAVGSVGQRQPVDASGHPAQSFLWMNKPTAQQNAANIDQNKAGHHRQGGHEMLSASGHNLPPKNVVAGAGGGAAAARGGYKKVAASNYLATDDHSNASFLRGQKLQSNIFKTTTDSCNDINLEGQLPHLVGNKGGAQPGGGRGLGVQDGMAKRDPGYDDPTRGGPNRSQFKHQIEVMVLSKVDPLDSAFPGAANISETNLSNSFLQAAPSGVMTGVKQGGLPGTTGVGPIHHQGLIPPANKRNPFKNGPNLGNQHANQDKSMHVGGQGALGGASQAKHGRQAPAGAARASRRNLPGVAGGAKKMDAQQVYQKLTANQSRQPELAPLEGVPEPERSSVPPSQINQNDHKMIDSSNTRGQRGQIDPASKGGQGKKAAQSPGRAAPDGTKYGKDFKIPELPPLLQAQLFGEDAAPDAHNLVSNQQNPWFSPTASAGNAQYKIKKFIDDIYQKEMKYRYHKQYVREDFLLTQSPIFDLKRCKHLRPKGDLLNQGNRSRPRGQAGAEKGHLGAAALNELGHPALHSESESLTNVLGFQAGGPHVVVPVQPSLPHYFTGAQSSEQEELDQQMQQSAQNQQQHQHAAPGGGVYNANQIFFGTAGDGGATSGIPPASTTPANAGSPMRGSPGTRKARHSTEARPKGHLDGEAVEHDGLASPPEAGQDGMLRSPDNEPGSSAMTQPQASAKAAKGP